MTWRHWLTDARTGRIIRPIDIPSFSWDMTVSAFGLSTTSKGAGVDGESSLTVPFAQFDERNDDGMMLHRATPSDIDSLLGMGRRALCSAWWYPGCADERGVPVMWGAIGEREDHWLDTSFPIYCPMDLLADRYAIRDGRFLDGTSTDTLSWTGLSLRGLAAELGSVATEQKNGGQLPIRWNYIGEAGNHQRTNYQAWNVQNLAVKTLLTNISNVSGGPDMGFRPSWSDSSHVIIDFIAASDADIYLEATKNVPVFSISPYGGTMELSKVSWALPIQRWYGTGAGTDASTITAIAEDLSEVTGNMDPPMLRESAYSDTNISDATQLKAALEPLLASRKQPVAQLEASLFVDDMGPNGLPIHPLGSFWPGERVDVDISGCRTLPDDRYPMRLMEMSGDQSDKITVKFDVFTPNI